MWPDVDWRDLTTEGAGLVLEQGDLQARLVLRVHYAPGHQY